MLGRLVACTSASLALIVAGGAWAGARDVALRATASVTNDTVTVGDVIAADGADTGAVAALPIGPAPRVGQPLALTRAQVQAALPAGWRVVGGASVRVERAAQDIAAAPLCDAALAAARARLDAAAPGARASVTCLDAHVPALRVPAGALALQADASAFSPVEGAQALRVDVRIAGRVERSVGVPLRVALSTARWCANAALAEGTPLAAASFARCERPVRHAEDLALGGQPLPAGRLQRALRAGDALVAADVAAPEQALAGDPVTVRLRDGAFELESAGVLVQSARVGARVHVRTAASPAPVVGTLTDRRVVELE
jgi:flagella basal body P-ring formation protein FlgA